MKLTLGHVEILDGHFLAYRSEMSINTVVGVAHRTVDYIELYNSFYLLNDVSYCCEKEHTLIAFGII